MDDADAADLAQQQALALAMSRRHATLPAVGSCYFCAEPIEGGRRFCDSDCLHDWERVEAGRRLREGRK